ncbi:MAG: hypothetical protein H0U71_04870 [Gammaproteobacteria bacterium]|nr:hypothetical protein [Gammaproteobacteria bacterium]
MSYEPGGREFDKNAGAFLDVCNTNAPKGEARTARINLSGAWAIVKDKVGEPAFMNIFLDQSTDDQVFLIMIGIRFAQIDSYLSNWWAVAPIILVF